MTAIHQLQTIRKVIVKLTSDLTPEQLLYIPTGFKNNILWNMAHLVVTQQLLHYGLSNQPMLVSDDLVSGNRKGSSPSDWVETPDVEEIKTQLVSLPKELEKDYQNGLFSTFTEYPTSAGITLKTIEDAIIFNNFHEGLHMGTIMAMRKLI